MSYGDCVEDKKCYHSCSVLCLPQYSIVYSHTQQPFARCCFLLAFKPAAGEKPGLDQEQVPDYWLISNLSTVSEVIEQLASRMRQPFSRTRF